MPTEVVGAKLEQAALEGQEPASRPRTPHQPSSTEQADPMSTFFQGQMDYIFFFYGLAFIGLGVVAYILSKEVNQRLPWGWLALFGFTHGANEWLDLVALCLGGRGVVWGPALGHLDRVFPLPGGIRPSQPDPKAGPGTGTLASGRSVPWAPAWGLWMAGAA